MFVVHKRLALISFDVFLREFAFNWVRGTNADRTNNPRTLRKQSFIIFEETVVFLLFREKCHRIGGENNSRVSLATVCNSAAYGF